MKRIEIYSRIYEYKKQEGHHGHESIRDNPDDTIDSSLYERCFDNGNDLCKSGIARVVNTKNFLWYDQGLFKINVDKDLYMKNIPENHYNRRVEIESMPPDARIPRGLLEILERYEFQKQESELKVL